jgi:hypothetical protein
MIHRVCSSLPVLGACVMFATGPLTAQSSREYQPATDAEAKVAIRATRDIYPLDVQDSLQRYAKTLVAWPGIVRRISYSAKGDSLSLVVEHHYFDWREDHGCQRELYFVSPRGEGLFTITIPSAASDSTQSFSGKPNPQSFVIVYGTPEKLQSVDGQSAVVLIASVVNSIEPRWYLTDAFSYGRAFANFRLIKVPKCSS